MTKLEAIAHLEASFAKNAEFKKAWADYIELSIIDVLKEHAPHIGSKAVLKVAKESGKRILGLFKEDWWSAQGLK